MNDDNNNDVVRLAATGNVDALKKLLLLGGDVDTQNAGGLTALAVAAMFANVSCVELLLHSGANVNARSANGSTPLIGAVSSRTCKAIVGGEEHGIESFLSTIRLLIDAGADVNAKTHPTNQTVLMYAKHPQIIDFLKKSGAK